MSQPIDIRPEHLAIVQKILRDVLPRDAKVWVFGSRAKWATKNSSDLDLAIDADRTLTRREEASLADTFEASDLPYKVDFIDLNSVSESFREIIDRDKVEFPKLEIPDGWSSKTLGEILILQRGYDLPAQDRKGGSYPIIASTGVVGSHSEAIVKAPGIVIGRSGSIGGGQYITQDFWPLNTTLYVKDFKGNDPKFCYYLLLNIDFKQFNVGGAVPTLNRNHIHPLPVLRPPLPEQKAIAAILGTLDDKIEANRRMNETLEGIARALFKSWFVDFDPVRRNMARQQSPHPNPPPHGGREQGLCLPHEGGGNTLEKPSPRVGEGWEGGRLHLQLPPEVKEKILQNARDLRKNLTEAEKLLWGCLRAHRLAGFGFRRQQPVGKYIVDFVCFEQKLIVEADGGQHANKSSDKERDAWLRSQGFHVLRFWNNDILGNIEGVLLEILGALEKPPLPTLPHTGGGLFPPDVASPTGEGFNNASALLPPPVWGRAGEGGDVPADLDALFPASFTDSPLGEIPAGWEVMPIGDVVTAVGGSTPSTSNPAYWEGGIHHWATPKDLASLGSSVLLATERQITDAGLSAISSGLLPAGSVLMSSRAPIGYIAINAVPVAINQGFIGIICDKSLPHLYVWQWVHENMDAIKGRANGSTFQEISKTNFRPLLAVIPSKVILNAYMQAVLPVWDKIVIIEKERQTLATLRDTLLPKLISGQIRVKDAEKRVEGVI